METKIHDILNGTFKSSSSTKEYFYKFVHSFIIAKNPTHRRILHFTSYMGVTRYIYFCSMYLIFTKTVTATCFGPYGPKHVAVTVKKRFNVNFNF